VLLWPVTRVRSCVAKCCCGWSHGCARAWPSAAPRVVSESPTLLTSALTITARCPWLELALSSAARASPSSCPREQNTTLDPASKNTRTHPSPIPLEPPVTTVHFPTYLPDQKKSRHSERRKASTTTRVTTTQTPTATNQHCVDHHCKQKNRLKTRASESHHSASQAVHAHVHSAVRMERHSPAYSPVLAALHRVAVLDIRL
jgi:hypothetical protein